MTLYLDDDIVKASLIAMLRRAGHIAVLPADVGMMGMADPRHLAHAIQHGRVMLTKNHNDFEDLHFLIQTAQGRHSGILAVRSDNDRKRDMKDRDIVRAIGKLEKASVPIANEPTRVVSLAMS